jgi:hypothetical protein
VNHRKNRRLSTTWYKENFEMQLYDYLKAIFRKATTQEDKWAKLGSRNA